MKKTRWMVGALLIAGMAQAEVVTLDESTPTVDLAVFAKTVGGTLNATSTKAIKAYNDSGYVDTGLRMVPGSAFGFHAFDVTSYVTNAVANGGTVSFRFQMLNDTSLPFGTDNRYALRSFRTTSQEPSLDLYIIP
jgi:hypothetical protein